MLCLQVTRWLKLFGFPNESSDWWLGFFWAGFFFFFCAYVVLRMEIHCSHLG